MIGGDQPERGRAEQKYQGDSRDGGLPKRAVQRFLILAPTCTVESSASAARSMKLA